MNVDQIEIDKFTRIANHWWDKNSEFKPLHDINPLRLKYINKYCNNLNNKMVLDVGCGGGILSESMTNLGATVKGIDLSDDILKVAKMHSLKSGIKVSYDNINVEYLAKKETEKYDVVTCLEILEHVPNPTSTIEACAELTKPNGWVFFSTINRNLKAHLFAIIGAEYILNLLPKGTHNYQKFITPYELDTYARQAGLNLKDIIGISYNLFNKQYKLSNDVSINYLCGYHKPC